MGLSLDCRHITSLIAITNDLGSCLLRHFVLHDILVQDSVIEFGGVLQSVIVVNLAVFGLNKVRLLRIYYVGDGVILIVERPTLRLLIEDGLVLPCSLFLLHQSSCWRCMLFGVISVVEFTYHLVELVHL